MKKLLITAALFIGLFSSASAGENDAINFSGARSFKKAFPEAGNIRVKNVDQLTKVSFTFNNQNYEVFYADNGDLVAKSKHISVDELPEGTAASISKKYSDRHITEVVEFTNEATGEKHYYASLSSGNDTVIIEAYSNGAISVFKN